MWSSIPATTLSWPKMTSCELTSRHEIIVKFKLSVQLHVVYSNFKDNNRIICPDSSYWISIKWNDHSLLLCVDFTDSYLIRPSSLSPQPSPLIDERKQNLRKPIKREEPTGAEKGKMDSCSSSPDAPPLNPVNIRDPHPVFWITLFTGPLIILYVTITRSPLWFHFACW